MSQKGQFSKKWDQVSSSRKLFHSPGAQDQNFEDPGIILGPSRQPGHG